MKYLWANFSKSEQNETKTKGEGFCSKKANACVQYSGLPYLSFTYWFKDKSIQVFPQKFHRKALD